MEKRKWNTGIRSLIDLSVVNKFVMNGSPLDVPDWYLQMLRNGLHAGRAPEPEVQQVTSALEEKVYDTPVLDP